jgi:hypothetical protein
MHKAFVIAVVLAASGILGSARAQRAIDKSELLTAQNKYRADLGLAPLRWSESLAQSAQDWAEQLAQSNQLKHSGGNGVGENLAMWTAGKASLTQLVDMWGAERQYFVHADFPSVTRTGNWETVAHYTQLIWKDTNDVGCGFATGGGNDFLVCQYRPRGNIFGQKVY